jgi:hypothetical protein
MVLHAAHLKADHLDRVSLLADQVLQLVCQ